MELNLKGIRKIIEYNKNNIECLRGVFLTLKHVKVNSEQESELKEIKRILLDILITDIKELEKELHENKRAE